MANFRVITALALLGFAGCSGPSVTKTTTNPPDPKAQAHERFVTKRTDELMQSGVCKNSADAEARAREEADRLFGPATSEYSTTTTWGPDAQRQKQQEQITAGLDKMKREQSAPNSGK